MDHFLAPVAVRYAELEPPYLRLGLAIETLKTLNERRNETYNFSHQIGFNLYQFKNYRVKRINWKKQEVIFEKQA